MIKASFILHKVSTYSLVVNANHAEVIGMFIDVYFNKSLTEQEKTPQ